jgi:hypothetical protein
MKIKFIPCARRLGWDTRNAIHDGGESTLYRHPGRRLDLASIWRCDRVWDLGSTRSAMRTTGDASGDDSMHLDPVDALTEAQQEEEEAEQGIVRSDLTRWRSMK